MDREFVKGQDKDAVQYIFVKEVLEKLVRLAYHDRIKGTLPESFLDDQLFPSKARDANFKFSKGFADMGKFSNYIHL
jgi:hypothetical protein